MKHIHMIPMPDKTTMILNDFDSENEKVQYAIKDGDKFVRRYTTTDYEIDNVNQTFVFDEYVMILEIMSRIINQQNDN